MKDKTKKTGLFGGTFDPIHLGHLITAQSVLLERKLEQIIFMPCFISPHKTEIGASLPQHRINMVKLAIEGYSSFSFSDYEINKEDISYTIDTIIYLRQFYDEIELIIGYDSLLNFETWKEPDKILDLAKVLVMKRNSNSGRPNRFFGNVQFVDTPVIDISSTEIRQKIRNNLPVNFLLPDNVYKYITENNLYK